ncbi:MAG: D-isomer specific 2-hydroxyacid dehydrogenase family protein [Acidimicrobiia bacterium]|nr:D-isomer specific 2-hydroxyacid dehydrogenase family protein [Acidimicrobiia bacterium]
MVNPKIAVEPKTGRYESLEEAVREAGGEVVPVADAQALVWADPATPHDLPGVLDGADGISWVALPFAGIEPYLPYLDHERVWTCARGVYARPVAEHALMLGLAGLRGLSTYARADSWAAPRGHNLVDGRITVLGAGGITEELIGLLAGFNCEITVVRRRVDPMSGAHRTMAFEDRLDAIAGADLVVLALALTPETEGVMGPAEFEAMESHAWVVNVARGGHVDHDALLAALEAGELGGACLDVTDPEPLPDGHPLWTHPRVIITPHVANTPEMGIPLLARHIRSNVGHFAAGEELEGVVDVDAGY